MAEGYDEAIRRRLSLINQWGDEANSYASQRAQAIQARRAAEQAQMQQQQSYAGEPTTYALQGTAKGDNFNNFLRAIAKRESGGRYGVVNRDSGALGKYQIMPGNVGPWSQAALGRRVSTSQFLKSPRLQEQIAQYQLRQYYNRYGAQGAAVAWYAGPGTAKKYLRAGGRGYNQPQGKYSSISAYALGILRDMGLR